MEPMELKIRKGIELDLLKKYGFEKFRDCYAKRSDIANDLLCVDIEKRVIYIDAADEESGDCADLLVTLYHMIGEGWVRLYE